MAALLATPPGTHQSTTRQVPKVFCLPCILSPLGGASGGNLLRSNFYLWPHLTSPQLFEHQGPPDSQDAAAAVICNWFELAALPTQERGAFHGSSTGRRWQRLTQEPFAPRDALHNPSRFVIARPRAVCGVAFIANSTRYWPQNAPCIPSRSALHTLALSYAEHP